MDTQPDGTEPSFMTTDQVAHVLGTTGAALKHWRAIGLGPSWVKVGGRVMYPRQKFAEFAAELMRQATPNRIAL